MKPRLFFSLALTCSVLSLAFAGTAGARPIDCSAEGQAGAFRCLVATERVQPGRDPLASSPKGASTDGSSPAQVVVWTEGTGAAPAAPATPRDDDDSAAFASAGGASNGDSPFLALLLATIGIVSFMAHRRGGG